MDFFKKKEIGSWKALSRYYSKYRSPTPKKIGSGNTKNEMLEKLFSNPSSMSAKNIKNDWQDSHFIVILKNKWEEIAGPLSRHSRPNVLKGKILYVNTEKSVYAQELSLYVNHLKQAVYSITGIRLEKIIVKTGFLDWGKETDNSALINKRKTADNISENKNLKQEEEFDPQFEEFIKKLEKI